MVARTLSSCLVAGFAWAGLGLATASAPPVSMSMSVAAAPSATAESALIAAEDRRFAAQIRGDQKAVADGLADELVYTHATGRVQTKTEILQALQSTGPSTRKVDFSDRTARVTGDMGTTHGVVRAEVGDRTLVSSYLAVYVWRRARWQLLFWQTSPGAQG